MENAGFDVLLLQLDTMTDLCRNVYVKFSKFSFTRVPFPECTYIFAT